MKRYKHLYLTGLMGSGKTTVGELAARRFGRKFVDLDQLIEEGTRTKISDIFDKYGENTFRNIETKVLELLPEDEYLIVATGGGAVIREENRQIMRNKGAIVWIDVPIDQLARRLKGDTQRPLLQNSDTKRKLEQIMQDRGDYYRDCTIRVDADNLTPLQVVMELQKIIRKKSS